MDRQTDGWTDGIAMAYTCYSIYAVARKNGQMSTIWLKLTPPMRSCHAGYIHKHLCPQASWLDDERISDRRERLQGGGFRRSQQNGDTKRGLYHKIKK